MEEGNAYEISPIFPQSLANVGMREKDVQPTFSRAQDPTQKNKLTNPNSQIHLHLFLSRIHFSFVKHKHTERKEKKRERKREREREILPLVQEPQLPWTLTQHCHRYPIIKDTKEKS